LTGYTPHPPDPLSFLQEEPFNTVNKNNKDRRRERENKEVTTI
jgi:hypothetical protein